MTVYVDDMMAVFGRMKMSHMIADSHDELLEMADAIGVDRRHIQHEGSAEEHFDVTNSKRLLAIKAGAKPITMVELGDICWQRGDA